jgi:hypothetical protein
MESENEEAIVCLFVCFVVFNWKNITADCGAILVI